jgi:hypothetical protein
MGVTFNAFVGGAARLASRNTNKGLKLAEPVYVPKAIQ